MTADWLAGFGVIRRKWPSVRFSLYLREPSHLNPTASVMSEIAVEQEKSVGAVANANENGSQLPPKVDLKTTARGVILDPQPSDDPADPLVRPPPTHLLTVELVAWKKEARTSDAYIYELHVLLLHYLDRAGDGRAC